MNERLRWRMCHHHSKRGGLVDVMGRLFGDDLSARLGQPIVIDNRVGGMT
jgi:tripartite-type tricarboxylate transporter receptor subunit TctC